jgi:hypothetical protein
MGGMNILAETTRESTMEFHNWGHNSQSEKNRRSYGHFTFSASKLTLKSKLFFGDCKDFSWVNKLLNF